MKCSNLPKGYLDKNNLILLLDELKQEKTCAYLYHVYGLGRYSHMSVYRIHDKTDLIENDKWLEIIRLGNKDTSDVISLWDCNIVLNNNNDNYIFTNKKQAERYLDLCLSSKSQYIEYMARSQKIERDINRFLRGML